MTSTESKVNLQDIIETKQSFSEKTKDTFRRVGSLALVGMALSGPMTGESRAESNQSLPKTTITELTPSWNNENRPITNQERYDVQKMVKNFNKVDSKDIPYDTIERMIREEDNKKFDGYRKELRELGCLDEVVVNRCAQWKYALDNFKNGIMKNSKATEGYNRLDTYITHEQINNYALTREGLNVYEEDGIPYFLMVRTDAETDQAFRETMEWYKENGVENAAKEFSDRGFCILFPYIFYEGIGFTMMSFDYNTGVINPNGNISEIKKPKKDGAIYALMSGLNTESAGIAHGRVMQAILGDNNLTNDFSYNIKDLEIIKSLMVSFNFDYLYGKTKQKLYKDSKESYWLAAVGFAKEYATSLNDPYIIRQVEMMTLGGLSKPLGADNWDFAKTDIEGLKGR